MNNLLTHPFFTLILQPLPWIILGLCVAAYFIQTLVHRETKTVSVLQTFWDVFGLKDMLPALRVALGFMWAVLFAAFLGAVIWTLLSIAQAILKTPGEDFRLYLLTLAAMTAGLSALIALPFTLIRTKNLTAQTNATEQGLVTDRLNKAVEGLGAQKEVNWIGRPVTVWTGEPQEIEKFNTNSEKPEYPDRSIFIRRERYDGFNQEGNEIGGWDFHFKQWPRQRTIIERQEEAPEIETEERVDAEGDWQVFKETVPNLEVRIGSIYALERIARENNNYHVQVMEILCAYVRENAPAKGVGQNTANSPLKTDIQIVITVLGRRNEEQRKVEWGCEKNPNGKFRYRIRENETPSELVWRTEGRGKIHHQLDLRKSDLSNVDFSGLDFSDTMFDGSVLDRANFSKSTLCGVSAYASSFNRCNFFAADLRGSNCAMSEFQTAQFLSAKLDFASFAGATLNDSTLWHASLEGAIFTRTKLQYSNLDNTKFDDSVSVDEIDLFGASLNSVDLTNTNLIEGNIATCFGDKSTNLAKDWTAPDHWSDKILEFVEYHSQWRKWKADLRDFLSAK